MRSSRLNGSGRVVIRGALSLCGAWTTVTGKESTRTGLTTGDVARAGCDTGEHATTLAVANSTSTRTGYLALDE
jgi:hypothetical protein